MGRVCECYAHLECRLEREIYHCGYILIVGKILAGYLDQTLVGSSGEIGLAASGEEDDRLCVSLRI